MHCRYQSFITSRIGFLDSLLRALHISRALASTSSTIKHLSPIWQETSDFKPFVLSWKAKSRLQRNTKTVSRHKKLYTNVLVTEILFWQAFPLPSYKRRGPRRLNLFHWVEEKVYFILHYWAKSRRPPFPTMQSKQLGGLSESLVIALQWITSRHPWQACADASFARGWLWIM